MNLVHTLQANSGWLLVCGTADGVTESVKAAGNLTASQKLLAHCTSEYCVVSNSFLMPNISFLFLMQKFIFWKAQLVGRQ